VLKDTLAAAIRTNPTDSGLRGALVDFHLVGKRGLEALAAAQERMDFQDFSSDERLDQRPCHRGWRW
jgi:hypothetical protein